MRNRVRKLKYCKIKYILTGICLLAGISLWQAGTSSAAATTSVLEQLEKAMVSSATKKIQYRAGKVTSAGGRYWRSAKTVSLSASKLKIKKKGSYTFRITKSSGKYKLFTLHLKKKTYPVSVNTSVKQKKGYYLLVPKSNTTQALGTKESSLLSGSGIVQQPKGQTAAGVWQLEPAGGNRFRLKNANSGLYLTGKMTKKKTTVTQKKLDSSNKGQLYYCYSSGGSWYYIKNVLTKEYLNIEGGILNGTIRHNDKAWKFQLVEVAQPESRLAVTGETYPVTLEAGSAFSLKGIVTSTYTMKSLTAQVVDNLGKVWIQKTVTPMACQYDLAGVDAAITFGKLAAGSYIYQVAVQDATGKTVMVVNRNFVVNVPAGASGAGALANNATTGTLAYNAAAVAATGHQSMGNDLEKKACASYALAYCNAILTGVAVNPHTYWSSSTNVDCVWSRGGYTTSAYGSEQEVLQAAYSQLLAGRPCILHVTGKTGSQHWVTLVGYKNVIAGTALTAANFIAIDPWNGETITVSDSYQVRNTYRLAYKIQ